MRKVVNKANEKNSFVIIAQRELIIKTEKAKVSHRGYQAMNQIILSLQAMFYDPSIS